MTDVQLRFDAPNLADSKNRRSAPTHPLGLAHSETVLFARTASLCASLAGLQGVDYRARLPYA